MFHRETPGSATTADRASLGIISINHGNARRDGIMSWLTAWIFRKYERAQEQSLQNQTAWLESLTQGILLIHHNIDPVERAALTPAFCSRKTA
jgi:hypothetical protein